MWILIGFVAVAFIILYKRSTEIITVNPLSGRPQAPLPGVEDAEDEPAEDEQPSFSGFLGALKDAAEEAARQNAGRQAKLPVNKGRAEIIRMVQNNQFIEAIQLYRRLYGVDLQTAKRAVDKMMLER